MSCVFDKEKLTGYFDGELDPAERSEVERHISACSECLRDLGEIKSAALLVRGLPRHRAPRSIAESVSREIAAAGGAARFRVLRGTLLWATAAAAALLIAVNVVYFAGLSKRPESPGAASRSPAAAPALATRVAEQTPEDGARPFGKAKSHDNGAFEKSVAPADKDRAAPGSTARRAADREAGNALRKTEGRVDGLDAGLKGAVPPAPAAPPAAAPAPSAALKDANEAAKTRKGQILDPEKADDGKKADLALLEEKRTAREDAKKAVEGAAAGEQAGGGGGPAVALTLASADPAAARSRAEAILRKLGARMEPSPGAEARALAVRGREAAVKPLAAALSEKQLAEFRKEIGKEKELLLVEGRAAEARKRLEENRAKAAARPAANEPAVAAGADPKTRGEAETGNFAKPSEPPVREPQVAPTPSEESRRQQAEPALIRVTLDFTALEEEPK